MTLYQEFNRFGPSRVLRICHPRTIPPVAVQLGDLVGLIYRSDKGRQGRPQAPRSTPRNRGVDARGAVVTAMVMARIDFGFG